MDISTSLKEIRTTLLIALVRGMKRHLKKKTDYKIKQAEDDYLFDEQDVFIPPPGY